MLDACATEGEDWPTRLAAVVGLRRRELVALLQRLRELGRE